MRNNLNVNFNLDRLLCHDEADSWGNAEPYLWTVFFKIDGATCRLNEGLFLEGTATVFTTPGSHGNLGTYDVYEGDTVDVPPVIGEQSMVLVPIPVPQFVKDAGTDDVAAIAGCIVVLMEEDNVTNDGAEAGHRALNTAVEAALNGIIPTLGFTNQTISDEELELMTATITNRVTDAVVEQQGLFENIWSWLNADDTIGTKVWKFTGDELSNNGTTSFQQRWQKVWVPFPPGHPSNQPGYWKDHGDWELFGNVTAMPIPSCPAEVVQELFDSLFGKSASTKTMAAMYAFREKDFQKYKGLSKWWELCKRNTPYLAAALKNKKTADAAMTLFKDLPSLLKDRKKPLSSAQIEAIQNLLQQMSQLNIKDRKSRRDLSIAMNALKMLEGKSVASVIDFLNSNAPTKYPAVLLEKQMKQSGN